MYMSITKMLKTFVVSFPTCGRLFVIITMTSLGSRKRPFRHRVRCEVCQKQLASNRNVKIYTDSRTLLRTSCDFDFVLGLCILAIILGSRHGAIWLHHKCNRLRLRLLATCSITITIMNKQNNNAIDYDYDYIESNHDYNRDYICLETISERKQKPICKVSRKYIFRQHTI